MVTYKFWYDYVKTKYDEKVKLCYMDTDSFIVYIKTNNLYKDIADNSETRFDTSNYELDRPLLKGRNKKVIGLMKNKIDEKIITKIVGLRVKIYSFLIDDGSEDKKSKSRKKCLIKKNLNLKIIKTV